MTCDEIKLAIAKRLVEGEVCVWTYSGRLKIEIYFKKMICIFTVEITDDKALQLELIDSTILKYINGRMYK